MAWPFTRHGSDLAQTGRMALWLGIAIVSWLGVPALGQSAETLPFRSELGLPTWRWSSEAPAPRRIILNLVNAEVVVRDAPGDRADLWINAPSAIYRRPDIAFDIIAGDDGIQMSDRYPGRAPLLDDYDCEPPLDARGDFRRHSVKLLAILTVPSGVEVDVRLLAGRVVDERRSSRARSLL